MEPTAWERLFDFRRALSEPAVVRIVGLLMVLVAIAPLILLALDRLVGLEPDLRRDLWRRYRSWLIMVPIILVPVLLGAPSTVLGVAALSLLCFAEFAAATGLFRDKLMYLLVVVGILSLAFAVADHWYRLFVALTPMCIIVITAVATSLDRPKGFIQRVALAIFGFLLFGSCLGHLSYLTNAPHYRSLILMLVFSTQMNDVFAYIVGKSIGGPRLAPQTNPDKTVAGALGALLLTTLLVFWLTGLVFPEGDLAGPVQRSVLGLVISIGGQVGDLTVAAIKRDAGIAKEWALIPGHGGALDRANSLLLSTPAMFHLVNHFTHFTGGI